MKRWFVWLVSCLTLVLLVVGGTSCTDGEEGDGSGKYPNLNGTTNETVVVAENGLEYTRDAKGESFYVSDIGTCTDAAPVIAATVNGLPVTAIGDYAFFGTDITSVTVPDGITAIGMRAFASCDSVVSIILPDSVTSIETEAFYKCARLERVELGEGLTALESYVLAECPSLQSVSIPDSVIRVAPYAFEGSACMKSERGVYYVDRWAVHCDADVTEVTLRADTVGIADMAFFANRRLQAFSLPSGIKYIGEDAFEGCDAILKQEGGVSYVDGWAVACDPSVTQITLRADTVGISDSAFLNCKGITSLTLNGAVSIDERAFYDFDLLESVIIGEGVTSVGNLAFASCDKLLSVQISESVTFIGKAAFSGCTALETMTVDDANSVYHDDGNCLIETESKTLIAGCSASVIPTDGSVTGIGDCAFYVCMKLETLNVPDCVTWIGADAFYACVNMESVTLGIGLERIEERAFLRCDKLASVYYRGEEASWNRIQINEQDGGNAPLLEAVLYTVQP